MCIRDSKLVIPNKEVLEVFVLQIREWFDRVVANDQASTKKINCGFLEGKVVAPEGMKVGIVAARFNEIIVNKLLGCLLYTSRCV